MTVATKPTGVSLPRVLTLGLAAAAASFVAGYVTRPGPAAGPRPERSHATRNDIGPARDAAVAAASDEKAESDAVAWERRWQALLQQPGTPARDRELEALLTELAKTEPQRALAMALAEGNWRRREQLRDAALRGWAAVDATAAGDWALRVRSEDRRGAVAAVLAGAAANPATAEREALRLCAADPEPAGDYGHAAITALVNAGAFETAVHFGTEVGTEKYPFLLKSAFYQWAHYDPAKAMAAVESIDDPVLRSEAADQVMAGWAKADAHALAEHALQAPPDVRARALAQALPHWVEKDPVAAGEWIAQHDTGAAFDEGTAAMANRQGLIAQTPTVALELAGNISDPAKRSHTMRSVFRQWAHSDPESAKRYLDRSLSNADRAMLIDEWKDLTPDG